MATNKNKKTTLEKAKKLDYLMLFLCGFFVFSPISSFISLNILNLPLALPELFFIPFYFRLRNLFNFRVNLKVLSVGLFIILFLFFIALLYGLFPIHSILSTIRGYFYLLIVFSVFKDKYIPDINYIYIIAIGSSIGWLLLNLVSFNMIIKGQNAYGILVVYGNMIALTLMIAISIVYNTKLSKYFVLAIILVISIFAGLRRQILVSFIAYILSFFTQLKFSIKKNFGLIISLILIVFTINTLYPLADSFIKEVSPALHYRVFYKSEQLAKGEIGFSDQTRLNSFDFFIENIEDYILPRGFVSKRTSTDKNTGIFVDSPYIELFHTFGLILSVIIIAIFFRMLLFHFVNFYKFNIGESAVCLVMGGVIIVLMFVESSFLNYPYITPLTGFVLSRILSKKNLIQ